MPMGPSPFGFVYFTGAKFAGYSAFAHFLRKKWNDAPEERKLRTFKIGGLRTLIGIGAGICYWLLFGMLAHLPLFRSNTASMAAFFVGLFPVRMAEWYWLLRIVFRERVRGSPHIAWSLVWGTIVSYALDAIGIAAAFVIPGGVWVC